MLFLCYSHERVYEQARAQEGDAEEEPQARGQVSQGVQARGQVAQGRQARRKGQARRRRPT